jgi:MOSC domain-containing protein YiiM
MALRINEPPGFDRNANKEIQHMWTGEITSLHLAPEAAAPMETRSELIAIAGVGIEGDRYAKEIGFFSDNKGPKRQVTLFETEILETILRDHNKRLAPDECRMNIITRGAPLSHLVGRTFRAGGATLRGVQLNEPCKHLVEVIGKPVLSSLIHRCGLNAEVLEGGIIRTGDPIEEIAPE